MGNKKNEEFKKEKKYLVKIKRTKRIKSSLPSVITQWKNKRGYLISLEKRLSALQDEDLEVNIEAFKKFNEELEKLDEKYRDL
ncbi:hypothetical protein H311_03360 [Anncaliia algerae PRA109]|nr:hypothetical protein H311_03360 [Anncaliia algerae PRA109]